MYGQMTAGSWIYIGTQGILQGTYETLAALARRHFGGTLAGRLVVTAGLGGMGGAQPLAVTMNGGVALVVEVDPARIERRLATRYLDERDAIARRGAGARRATAARRGSARSIALEGNAADVLPELVRRGVMPDVAHRSDVGARRAERLRARTACRSPRPTALRATRSRRVHRGGRWQSMATHVRAMLELQARGAVTFDYGNNIRAQAQKAGVDRRVRHSRLRARVHPPAVLRGQGPVPLGGALGRSGRHRRDRRRSRSRCSPTTTALCRWIRLARERVAFQGLPARIFWLGYGERARFGLAINDLVRRGVVKAPIVIGRDHLDTGSVASPNRETEGMRDGSDAIADWPVLNALLNTSSGATWVSVHHGGGVGIGYSLHAGMVIVADGTREADEKLQRVLTCDPGIGVVRHADAGYPDAIATARAARHRHADRSRAEGRADDDSGAPGARAARARGARRLGRSGPRIPVVLGGCGTGRTSLLLRLRDLIGRTSAQYIDVERIATTPERFLQVAARRRRRSRASVRQRPRAEPARATRSTPRWRSSTRRARRGGAPATFLLDEFLELRTFESFPGLRTRAARPDRRARRRAATASC